MRTLYRSVVLKRELSRKAKLSVFKSIFGPILTYGHESWLLTQRVQSEMQEMRFLRKIKGVTMFDNFVTLQFEIFSTSSRYSSSRYLSGSNDLSLDGLATQAECFMNGFLSKLYMPK